ncbi:MAG: hypothetical protein JXQ29_11180 [Planctomycetes bacterium]|nr:hypothetical protein [Planctomycetota bacterium]
MRKPGPGGGAILAALTIAFAALPCLAQPWWIPRYPTTSPSARYYHAMACDALRHRVVLFGGSPNVGGLNDTWEWDGTNWTQRTPATSPPARAYHAMVFDAARGRVLLFGGAGAAGALSDTWEWDGTNWTLRAPATSPPARSQHAMAYDAARGRTVLFGGTGTAGSLQDTWEWDGANWIALAPATRPPVRYGHAMAYDAARGRIVLFGGSGLGDTWEWNGSAWTQRRPAESPPDAPSYFAMAYDATRRRCVLYPAGPLFATWEWDGTTWTEHIPSVSPHRRYGHAMVYDTSRVATVLFGGFWMLTGLGNDTWLHAFPATFIHSGTRHLGTTMSLCLRALGEAGRAYQVGSSLGAGPIPLGGRTLGLSLDPLLIATVAGAWPAVFQQYRGTLDSSGNATAAIAIPNHGALVGLTIHSAYVTFNPLAPYGIQSVSSTESFVVLL